MAAVLTYDYRNGQLAAVAGGKTFHLPVHLDPAKITAWDKVQELRSGKVTLWDHCFEPPQAQARPDANLISRLKAGEPLETKLELYDYPGEYAQRFDPVSKGPHAHTGPALYVGTRARGIHIHGWPPCTCLRCVVVGGPWAIAWREIRVEKELTFALERPPKRR